MKTKVFLAILLLLSLAFSIVVGIGFLRIRGHLKAVNRERNLIAGNLVALRGAKNYSDAVETNQFSTRTFVSCLDGEQDKYALILPSFQPNKIDYTLIVYLHGMGSTYLEPFTCPAELPIAEIVRQKYPSTAILSCSYRGSASWGNDKGISDITQNIRAVVQEFPVKNIVVMGTSMGGCTALTYAATAPDDVKQKIIGVVSVESAGDLTALFSRTDDSMVKPAIVAAFGGLPHQIPQVYQEKSFLSHINELNPNVRVAIISAKSDKVVPAEFQRDIANKLKEKNYQIKLIEIEGGHGAPPAEIYGEGLEYVITR